MGSKATGFPFFKVFPPEMQLNYRTMYHRADAMSRNGSKFPVNKERAVAAGKTIVHLKKRIEESAHVWEKSVYLEWNL
jgi:hypothetical protein